MKTKIVYESLRDFLKPKSTDEIVSSLNAKTDLIFKISNKSPIGTSLQGMIPINYNKLVDLFGLPNSKGDDYKVSTEWILEDNLGRIVTIYDYKETNLYSSELPTVSKFRKLNIYDWHIGANDKQTANDLIAFILLNSNLHI